jgi:hypothetical protein
MKGTKDMNRTNLEKKIIKELAWHLSVQTYDQDPPMYSFEPEEERKKVKKLRKALKTVLRYYGHEPKRKETK